MSRSLLLPLAQVIRETPDAISLYFEQPLVDRIAYHAGQYLTLKVEIGGKTYYRSYSISSTPRLDRYLQVTIKAVPGGLVSNHLLNHATPGQIITFLSPAGRFVVETSTKNVRHLVLVAGGSGITPLFSILRAVLYHEPQSRVSLLYATRKETDIIFGEQLKELEQRFPDRFALKYVYSQPEHSVGRRLLAADIPPFLENLGETDLPRSYWLCGPTALMKQVQAGLALANVPAESIQQERFVADEQMEDRQKTFDGPTRTVSVDLHGELHRIQVPSGSNVLEAGLQQGLDLPYSCKRGICSTCMAQLESGEVEMANPESLLDFEKELGKVLVCQCHPMSDDVRIRIG